MSLPTMGAVMPALPSRAALLLSASFLAVPARAEEAVACVVTAGGYGAAELACPIAAAPQARVLRFAASFAGVHDDSQAAVGVRIDGQAVGCNAGSRARLEGDAQGDALSCAIAVPPAAQARQLRLQLIWHHAEPAGYRLRYE